MKEKQGDNEDPDRREERATVSLLRVTQSGIGARYVPPPKARRFPRETVSWAKRFRRFRSFFYSSVANCSPSRVFFLFERGRRGEGGVN